MNINHQTKHIDYTRLKYDRYAPLTLKQYSTLLCRYALYNGIYAGKLIWGIDCNIRLLINEIQTMYRYITLLRYYNDTDLEFGLKNCKLIKYNDIDKIKLYLKQVRDLSNKSSKFCKDC